MTDTPRIELTIAPGTDSKIEAHLLAVWELPNEDIVESHVAVVESEIEAHQFASRWAMHRGACSYWM